MSTAACVITGDKVELMVFEVEDEVVLAVKEDEDIDTVEELDE